MDQLRKKYPKEVRVVFKHLPLPMHSRARPAHNLAIFALKKGAPGKFFEAARLLLAHSSSLDEAALRSIAMELGLKPEAALAAANEDRYARIIEADQKLAKSLGMRGVPQSFVNGRRVRGNPPLEKMVGLVEDRLAVARKMVTKGVARARLYSTIMRSAEVPESSKP